MRSKNCYLTPSGIGSAGTCPGRFFEFSFQLLGNYFFSITPAPFCITPAPICITPAPICITPSPICITPAPFCVTPARRFLAQDFHVHAFETIFIIPCMSELGHCSCGPAASLWPTFRGRRCQTGGARRVASSGCLHGGSTTAGFAGNIVTINMRHPRCIRDACAGRSLIFGTKARSSTLEN